MTKSVESSQADATPRTALATECARCGGSVAVVVAGPRSRCSFCGSDDPLAPALKQRAEKLRARIGRQQARDQQLMGRQSAMVENYGCINGYIPMLIGMLGVPVVVVPLADKPESLTLLDFFFGDPIAHADYPNLFLPMAWWVAYSVVLLIGLTFALWSLVGFAMRRVTRFAYPLPPPEPGGRPGCRVCGAELNGHGAVQRCDYCRSDHIVIGGRYQKHARSIDEALDTMEAQLDTTLARRDAWGRRLVKATIAASTAVLVLVPVAALFTEAPTAPGLWWIPVASVALAIVANRIQRRWLPVPVIRGLCHAYPGQDQVVAGGQAYEVASKVSGTGSDMYEMPVVVMLASGKEAPVRLAVVCYQRDDAGARTSVHEAVSESRADPMPERHDYAFNDAQGRSSAHVELAGKALCRIVANQPGAPDQVRSWAFKSSQLDGADVYVVQQVSKA